jgi:serine/threonine protein kinase
MEVSAFPARATRWPVDAVLPKPGDVIGRKYRVSGLAARGGMAAILSAEHLVLGQRVAVKVMLAEAINDVRAVERFLREAQATSRLESEHVARVMDARLLDSGLPYLVMEYLEGRDLGALLAMHGRLPCDQVAGYALEALEGLAHAHAAGIVHRDLKPSNLFVARRPDASEVLKLLDFGVSKSLTDAQDECAKTLTGNAIVGSPVYMSPEQVRCARTVDERSDFLVARRDRL